MKTAIMLAMLMMSTFALATEVILMPGSNAACESKYDTFRSLKENVYSIRNPEVKDLGENIELTVTVKLLRCVEEDGKFKFVLAKDHMKTTYTSIINANGETYDVEKIDLEKEILAVNSKYAIASKAEVTDPSGEEEVSLLISKEALDTNKFPAAASRGKYFINLMLRSRSKFITPSSTIGPMIMSSGEFRIFFNL